MMWHVAWECAGWVPGGGGVGRTVAASLGVGACHRQFDPPVLPCPRVKRDDVCARWAAQGPRTRAVFFVWWCRGEGRMYGPKKMSCMWHCMSSDIVTNVCDGWVSVVHLGTSLWTCCISGEEGGGPPPLDPLPPLPPPLKQRPGAGGGIWRGSPNTGFTFADRLRNSVVIVLASLWRWIN